jgi:hypothetical protein
MFLFEFPCIHTFSPRVSFEALHRSNVNQLKGLALLALNRRLYNLICPHLLSLLVETNIHPCL